MMTFRFANPAAFQFLWIIPIIIALAVAISRRQVKVLNKQLGEKVTPFLTASISHSKRKWKLILELLCVVLMVFALARPQSGESKQKVKSEGVELMLLVDVSNSMLAEDAKPSRLELVKKEINRFLDRLGGDKVGLIAFAGSAILLSPLTNDKSSLKMFVDSLSPAAVATQGTEFRKALQEARSAFARGGVGEEEPSSVTRTVVIVSDGEDNEVGTVDAAEEMIKDGIRIFTMGVGTESGGPIPMRDERSNLIGYRKDKQGQVVMSKTKGTTLRDLAKIGKGGFYHITLGSQSFDSLSADIDKLEKAEFETAELTNFDENYQPFLFLAIVIALIELLLGERKGGGRIWRGRFEVAGE